MPDLATQAAQAAAELQAAVAATDPADLDRLNTAIAGAGRIVLAGCGREALMMRAFAMRLFHMGLAAHLAGEVTCPPVGPGDLVFVAAGPGELATMTTLVTLARAAGAQTLCLTAEPQGATARAADGIIHLTAQTMASDQGAAATSLLPMGSVFEGAMFLFFELAVLDLRDRLGIAPADMRARHANLE